MTDKPADRLAEVDDGEAYWQAMQDAAEDAFWEGRQAEAEYQAQMAALDAQREAEAEEQREIELAEQRHCDDLRRARDRELLDRLAAAARGGDLDVRDRTFCEEMSIMHETDATLSERQKAKALAILAKLGEPTNDN
ncbi:hypothetical protein [Bradyrhizobium sp. USDA 3364]